ncbi:hypothetical protein ACS0TY_011100 [Phlomoides rotata]
MNEMNGSGATVTLTSISLRGFVEISVHFHKFYRVDESLFDLCFGLLVWVLLVIFLGVDDGFWSTYWFRFRFFLPHLAVFFISAISFAILKWKLLLQLGQALMIQMEL